MCEKYSFAKLSTSQISLNMHLLSFAWAPFNILVPLNLEKLISQMGITAKPELGTAQPQLVLNCLLTRTMLMLKKMRADIGNTPVNRSLGN